MGKKFNVNGDCKPDLHYMVNIDDRLCAIKTMVDNGDYFTINRARQYGKTTTLKALQRFLKKEYIVVSMDFQMISASKFRDENSFSITFARLFLGALKNEQNEADNPSLFMLEHALRDKRDDIELFELFELLSGVCGDLPRPAVLIVDEVDSASNNQVFLDFLAQLRKYYIDRDTVPTFRSVILAGVYDVRNIQFRIRPDATHKVNSPWNIAADFLVDMDFSPADIAGMLVEYENDHKTGMDLYAVAEDIYDYTSGYPYLVSRICKLIDERVAGMEGFPDKAKAWTKAGITEAVKILLTEKNTLFESLAGKLADYPKLHDLIYAILFQGNSIPYTPLNGTIEMAEMLGFIKNLSGNAVVSNRIFETVLYNLLLSEEMLSSEIYKAALQEKGQFVEKGHLNMRFVLERFVVHFNDLYGELGDTFLEEAGRRYFLLYLKPIINGTGNYYIEARTRNMERTDVVVDYNGEQFVIELKLWRGNAYHERGEEQLLRYLDYYHLEIGYMISFNFNKNKQTGVKEITLDGKTLVEAVV